jgi:hypothetical protein
MVCFCMGGNLERGVVIKGDILLAFGSALVA